MIDQKSVNTLAMGKTHNSVDLMSQRKIAKRATGGFSSLSQKLKLNVDLSEEQLKISETVSVPMSCQTLQTRRQNSYENLIEEIHEGSQFYGASSRRGDFRRTQEDRVSNFLYIIDVIHESLTF